MKILLDTQAFLWLQTEPERFSGRTLSLLTDRANDLFFSAASAWEIAIKYALGKLDLPTSPAHYLPRRMSQSGILGLPVQHAHALRAGALPQHHRDPFDRMLVAQAQIERMPLLSADPLLAAYEVRMLAP
jgi:PIN domain nuclease of toxin-antitoxin system